MISVCPRPRRKNRDNSMLPDFHNSRVVLIIVLQITPILMKIKSWNFLHVVDIFILYKFLKKFKSIADFFIEIYPVFSIENNNFLHL